MPHVTVLGLGLMGSALAAAFAQAGHNTTVWNRTPGRTVPGTSHAPTAQHAIDASPLIVVCLTTYDAVHDLLDPLDLTGKTLVNLTSGTPDQISQARWTDIDGKIMAVPPQIGNATILYSGNPLGEHEETLKALGTTTHLGADPTLAAVYDMALLTMLYTQCTGYLHALALVKAKGVDAGAFLPHAQAWNDELLTPLLTGTAHLIDAKDYSTDVSTLLTNQAGLDHIVDGSEALGLSPALLLPIKDMIDHRVATGHGNEGLAGLIEEITR